MNVLITGATGYLGSVIAEHVRKAGHKVTVLARSQASAEGLGALGYEVVRGDIRDAQRVADLAARVDATIHAANTQDASNADVDMALARAVLASYRGTEKRFVYTSGAWSFQNTGEHVFDELTPADPLPLVAWRVAIEREVLASQGVVIRPAIVYGRGEKAPGILGMLVAQARKGGVARYVGDGRQDWPLVHVDDLADLYVRALVAPPGSLLHGMSGASVAMRDLALAASYTAGVPGRVAAWALADARATIGPVADAFALSQRISSARTRALTGWEPSAPTVFEELLVGSYARRPAAPLIQTH